MKNEDGLSFFSDKEKEIIEFLKDKTLQSKKTILSALFVLTKKKAYQELMIKIMKEVNENAKKQQKNEKQTENWLTPEEIKKIYEPLEIKSKLMLNNKTILNESTIMDYMLVSLLGGVIPNLPPRRSQDYTEMKIKDYDTKKDNYYKAGKFYFNIFKTAKTYGLQTLDVPAEFNTILKKWIKISNNPYLLYSSNGNKLTSPQITKMLNKVFDKRVSTSLLRHIFLTNKYKNMPALTDIQDLATKMAQSPQQAMEYIKR
jgi:mRNA-degrading endonuclease HigB of HigAB toxin-antitoxin module